MTRREYAREIIHEFKKSHPELDAAECRRQANKEYPWGIRDHHPYQEWLKAMNDVFGPSKKKIEAQKKRIKELPLFKEEP